MLIVFGLSVHAKFPEVVREKVCLGAEVEFTHAFAHATQVLPHEVFAANLERLWEVIHLLILSGLLQMIRPCLPRPHDVPLGGVRSNDPKTSCLQCVND